MSIQELLQQAVADQVGPGLVALVCDQDGVLECAAAGVRGLEDERPVGEDTMFRVMSMTKAMTSVGALALLEDGEIELEQPAAEILPELGDLQVLEGFDREQPRLRPAAHPILVRHLLTHTSGLGYWFSSPELIRWHELTGTPNQLSGQRRSIVTPLLHDPGERWTYGVSTDWLGQLVEKVSGRSLEDQLRARVWEPLDMPDTTFFPSEEQFGRMMQMVSRSADGGLRPAPFEVPEFEFASGGGGAHSTPRDYARFQRMLLRGGELDGERVLQPETVELMFTDHLHGAPLPEFMPSADTELTLDVPSLPFRQGWGLGLHLVLEDIPNMRHAGSGDWAGLLNSYYWIDRTSGICCLLMNQLLPFFDQKMVQTLLGFEATVYSGRA